MIALLALLLAGPPDTLRLGPGVHQGPLVISRPTVVLGAPGAILHGSGVGSVLEISAPGTTVRGIRIEHGGRNVDRDDAGVMIRADSVTLEDLQIRDVLFGVYLRKVRAVTLRRLDIEGPRGLPESQMGNGIHLHYSRDVVIDDSRIAWVRDGMYFEYTDSARVRGNRVTHVRFGLHYMFSHFNRFERNVFDRSAAGAVIMNSNGLVIRDNVFAWNSGGRSFGLVLQTATEPQVEGNLFVGNGIGTFFDNVIRGRYTGNLVAGNWLGLQLFGNSETTQVTGNAVIGNTFDASGGATPGAYVFCAHGGGNYWHAAEGDGYDLDGDGILDRPYQASSPLAELARGREGLRLFLGSPAARALDWAERTFPVFAMDQAEDACPLARAPALESMAALPGEGDESGTGSQYAVAAATLAAGAGILAVPARRRRTPRVKEPRS
ncbi:MAG: nitrous oxide reductase family maturation protein NosD [Gemmatimonadales bacterium]